MSFAGLLVVVVILGVLMVSAIVGLRSMSADSNGASPAANAAAAANLGNAISSNGAANIGAVQPTVACEATAAAARSASTLYFANGGGTYPVKWSDLTAATPALYKPANVVINAANPRELDGPGWKLVMSGRGSGSPTFTCA